MKSNLKLRQMSDLYHLDHMSKPDILKTDAEIKRGKPYRITLRDLEIAFEGKHSNIILRSNFGGSYE